MARFGSTLLDNELARLGSLSYRARSQARARLDPELAQIKLTEARSRTSEGRGVEPDTRVRRLGAEARQSARPPLRRGVMGRPRRRLPGPPTTAWRQAERAVSGVAGSDAEAVGAATRDSADSYAEAGGAAARGSVGNGAARRQRGATGCVGLAATSSVGLGVPGWPCDRDGESRGTVGELIVVGADFCIGCIGLTWAELILGSSADSQWLF